MSIETFRTILGKEDITDEELEVLLKRATRKAINHFYWKEDDIPTEEQEENFIDRYEYEIYDLAKTMYSVAKRDGLKMFSELGVTREWETGGDKSVERALSAIPVQTYVM